MLIGSLVINWLLIGFLAFCWGNEWDLTDKELRYIGFKVALAGPIVIWGAMTIREKHGGEK